MKFLKCFFLLLIISNNNLFAMNAKHNSLISFFGIEKFCSEKDINKNFVNHYFVDKKWWYVDQEIQFSHSTDDIPEIISSQKNDLYCIGFNRSGTEIVVAPFYATKSYHICIWNRDNSEELKRVDLGDCHDIKKMVLDEKYSDRLYLFYNHIRFDEGCTVQERAFLAQSGNSSKAYLDKNKKKLVALRICV